MDGGMRMLIVRVAGTMVSQCRYKYGAIIMSSWLAHNDIMCTIPALSDGAVVTRQPVGSAAVSGVISDNNNRAGYLIRVFINHIS